MSLIDDLERMSEVAVMDFFKLLSHIVSKQFRKTAKNLV
jgi:hypothetical protein